MVLYGFKNERVRITVHLRYSLLFKEEREVEIIFGKVYYQVNFLEKDKPG
jgi:hypothetical protein